MLLNRNVEHDEGLHISYGIAKTLKGRYAIDWPKLKHAIHELPPLIFNKFMRK